MSVALHTSSFKSYRDQVKIMIAITTTMKSMHTVVEKSYSCTLFVYQIERFIGDLNRMIHLRISYLFIEGARK